MGTFLKWSLIGGAIAIGTAMAVRAVKGGRDRLKGALGHAEAIAERTQAVLDETQSALRSTREAI